MAVNRYPLKCKSLERQSDLGIRVRDHPGKHSGPAVVLHTYQKKRKKGNERGRVEHASPKVKFHGTQVKKENA